MAARPNFTEVRITGGKIRVKGNSIDDPLPIDIRVYLEQENPAAGKPAEIAFGSVDELTTAWRAELPCGAFKKGPAVASGVEIRMEPFTLITWTQPVEIG